MNFGSDAGPYLSARRQFSIMNLGSDAGPYLSAHGQFSITNIGSDAGTSFASPSSLSGTLVTVFTCFPFFGFFIIWSSIMPYFSNATRSNCEMLL